MLRPIKEEKASELEKSKESSQPDPKSPETKELEEQTNQLSSKPSRGRKVTIYPDRPTQVRLQDVPGRGKIETKEYRLFDNKKKVKVQLSISELGKQPPLTKPKESSQPPLIKPEESNLPRPKSPETVVLVEPKSQLSSQPSKGGRVTVYPDRPTQVKQQDVPGGWEIKTKEYKLFDNKKDVKVDIRYPKPKTAEHEKPTTGETLPRPVPPPSSGQLPTPKKPEFKPAAVTGRTKSQDLLEYLNAISSLTEVELEHHEIPSPDFLESADGTLQVLKKFGIPDQGKCLESLLDTDSVRFDFGGLMRQYYSYVLRSYCLINMQERYRGLHHSTPCFSAIDLSKIGTREEEQDKITKAKMRKLEEERKRLRAVSRDADHYNYLRTLSNNQPMLLPLTIVHTMNEAMAPFLEDVFRLYGKNLGTEHKCTKEAGFHYMKIRKRCEMYNNICGGSTLDENLEQFYT